MPRPAPNEVVHIKYPSMVWSRGYIHNGGDFFACRLITMANDPRGEGPAVSESLGAGITTYDGCSIEQPPPTTHDESFVVLGGMVRILTEPDYSRVIEAKFGDVFWLPKGAFWKFEGEKGSLFYTVYPVDPKMRKPAPADGSAPKAKHFRSHDMKYSSVSTDVGAASICALVTPEISKDINVSIRTYDGCSIEDTAVGDTAITVLNGTLQIATGDNFAREMTAKFSDVLWVPAGTRIRYGGEKAKVFSVVHPV